MDFQQCPLLFYFKAILRLGVPQTPATAVGILAHYAFEHVFDLPAEERTADAAAGLVRVGWETTAEKPAFAELAADLETVEQVIARAEELVRNWFAIEHPQSWDPYARELYLRADFGGVEVHGYIDRLDKVDGPDGQRWFITDYKTGKVVQDRYAAKALFPMNVYAALLYKTKGVVASELRLLYVRNGSPEDIRRQAVTERTIEATIKKVRALWKQIRANARRNVFPANTGPLCQWCHFQDRCPAWQPSAAGVPIPDRDGRLVAPPQTS